MKTYGYIRVSTKEQNLDRQIDALKKEGITGDFVFEDKQSGKDFDCPAYKKLMAIVEPGDIIVIKSIDRLGRDYDDTIDQWRIITKEKQVVYGCLTCLSWTPASKRKTLRGHSSLIWFYSFLHTSLKLNVKP